MIRPRRLHKWSSTVAAGAALATQMLFAHGAERSAHGLCRPDETTFFACQTSRQRSISLCGRSPRELQYRFGTPAKIELRFPDNTAEAPKVFELAHYFRYRTDRTEVSFRNGGSHYAVFDYSEEDGKRHAGVRVTIDGKESQLVCSGRITSRLEMLEGVLRCDPDNALNMGACRGPSPSPTAPLPDPLPARGARET